MNSLQTFDYSNNMLWLLKRIFFGRKLSKKVCTKLSCFIVEADNLSYREQVVQYDKIYHHILKELGYEWSFGQILKRCPSEVKNLQEVWDLHKLRNSLVHDLKARDEKNLKKQAYKYRQICESFVRQVSS